MVGSYSEDISDEVGNPREHVVDALTIARKGEGRARNLDLIGLFVVSIGVLATVLAVSVALIGEGLDGAERLDRIYAAIAMFLSTFVTGAIFLGFGALVRNSSRQLSVSVLSTAIAHDTLAELERKTESGHSRQVPNDSA